MLSTQESSHIIPIPLPPKLTLEIRDTFIDRLRSETVEQILDEEAKSILAWRDEPNPFLARSKKLLSTAHTEEEFRSIVRRIFLSIVKVNTTALIDEEVIAGGAPYVVAFGIGVASGIVATWIYDEFIEGDETYTTIITDSGGTNWSIETTEDGRVVSIRREDEAASN